MLKKKLLAGTLSLTMVLTMLPVGSMGTTTVSAADSPTPKEITIEKNDASSINPINGFDESGNPMYGGDPSVLVDGDTVYLYVGRDSSVTEGYYMLDWACYSTKDLQHWNYEGIIMSADKKSITWANTGTDAWAGQVAKYNDKYYFYYCTWDATSSGKQSIGVAVSDDPTGPFKDIGHPLVKGTQTTGETSGWNDIDPTVWIETDNDGTEHRYLNWGNGKNFICELNEDMISVKDINGDGKITFGTQASGATSQTADIIEMNVNSLSFTEAPWLYRRQDSSGEYYGDYYLFYAYGWREQMAYATIKAEDGLMDGKWSFQKILMEPTATSNTNHMAVFDFNGKTYFIYHNGSLPGGSGFRRTACIAEVHFNDDGSIEAIPETAIGINGTTSTIYSSAGKVLTHDSFHNSSSDDTYPYTNINIKGKEDAASADAQWVLSAGKADKKNEFYVSIQSENKPGLYLTANSDKSVKLAQDANYSAASGSNIIQTDKDTAKKQTFKTVEGLADNKGVSFESVSQPGYYLTLIGDNSLCITNGSRAAASTFYLNEAPTVTPGDTPSSENSLKDFKITGFDVKKGSDNKFSATVPYETKSVDVIITLSNEKGYYTVNGVTGISDSAASVNTPSMTNTADIQIYAEDGTLQEKYTLTLEKSKPKVDPVNMSGNIVYSYSFDNTTGNAYAVDKVQANNPTKSTNPTYTYKDGVNGKAIYLDGTYGLDLGDANKLGSNYTISFWMNPDELHTGVDPIFTAGTFNPECWLNLTFVRPIWSKNGEYVDDAGTVSYTAGKWQHVICTVKGTSGTLYIDGEVAASGSVAEGIMTCSGSRLYFGINGWDALFKGAVDDVVLLNRSITQNEARAIAYNYANIANKLNTTPKTPPQQTVTVKAPAKTSINSVTNTAKGILVKWKKVSGATGYYVYRNNKKVKTITKNSTVSYYDTAVKSKNGSKYTYKVYAYKKSGSKTATSKASSSKTIYRLTAPTSLNLSASAKKKLKVKWKKNTGVTGYTIQYASNSKFKSAKTVNVKSAKTVTATLKSLKSKKNYYVRIRSYKKSSGKTYTSAWSSAKKKKTK